MNEIILPAQIRAGRALVDLSQDQLAEAAQVGVSTLRDFESQRRSSAGDAVAQAIEAGRAEDGRLLLRSRDFPQAGRNGRRSPT